MRKIRRFAGKGIDPVNRSVAITNWSNFGVYDISFLGTKPLYFAPVSDWRIPWLSSIVEGFCNRGLIYSAQLPTQLVQKLKQPGNLRRLHQYRDADEPQTAQIENFSWLR